MKRLWTLGIILVMTGCCNSGGIKGAIEYQVDACDKTGFSKFAFGYGGGGNPTIEVEVTADTALINAIQNAATVEANAIRRAQWLQDNPDGN